MLLTPELKNKIKNQLNFHFGIDIEAPKIKLIKNPLDYFQYYTGEKRNFSMKEMIELDQSVTLYYDDLIKAIVFKGFRRNGLKSFKFLSKQSFHVSWVLHEWIHHIQVSTGGYGLYDFFDEACCETVTYVVTADIERISDYWPWICRLWNFLNVIESNPLKKYKLIKEYNITENKIALHTKWINIFLKKYPKIANSKKGLINILESDNIEDIYAKRILEKVDSNIILQEFYWLHDQFKSELYNIFK